MYKSGAHFVDNRETSSASPPSGQALQAELHKTDNSTMGPTRPRLKANRYSSGALVGLGLAAVLAASACTPLPAVLRADGSGATKTAKTVPKTTARSVPKAKPANPMPTYASPYAIRRATPHVVRAPAITAYPWANDTTNGNDAYGLTKRQCVSYVGWYLNAHGTPFGLFTRGPKGLGIFSNASGWDAAARAAGFTVSRTPVVGSVAQWHANESSSWTTDTSWGSMTAGPAGHVAIVTKVYANGNVDVAQFNLNDARSFNRSLDVRAPRYIYVPLSSPIVR